MAKSSVVAIFPPGYLLENITATHDGGLFITCANRKELYYVHPNDDNRLAQPILVHSFPPDQWAMGIVQAPDRPNVFFILTSDAIALGSKTSQLHILDLSDAAVGCRPKMIMQFPAVAKALNGLCFLSPNVLLAADSFASCIWRVDLTFSSNSSAPAAEAHQWFSHSTMAAELVLPDIQPGINGLKYSAITQRVYYTNTQQKVFCQVCVNEHSLEPVGDVEIIDSSMPGDDLIIDDRFEDQLVAYVTTHRDNTVVKVPLDGGNKERSTTATKVVARGTEEHDHMLGPTAGTWAPGMIGKRAFFTTDGGLKHVPGDGVVRSAKVVRLDFSDDKDELHPLTRDRLGNMMGKHTT